MRTTYFRHALLATFILISTLAFAQTNTEKIKGKWSIDKFETDKNTPQAVKAREEMKGVYLTFGNGEVVITKKTEGCEDFMKKGPYSISANSIILGKDQDAAEILLLSEKNITIKIPGQGVLYLVKI
jgi:hypothetical protein